MTTVATGFGNQEYLSGFNQPDSIGTQVLASSPLLNLAMTPTTPVDILGYRNLEYVVRITNKGASMTRLDMVIQFSELTSPSTVDSDWALIQTQSVSSGVATLSDYTMQKDVTNAVVPFAVAVSIPVRARWMRLKLQCGAGDATGSAATVSAIRR